MNAPLTAQVAEIDEADHLVGDEQRIGIGQQPGDFSEIEGQVLELLGDFLVLGDELPATPLDHLGQLGSQQHGEIRLHGGASGDDRLTQQIAQRRTADGCRGDLRPLSNEPEEDLVVDDHQAFIGTGV